MRRQLVECIPNFSEGRRPGVIRAIIESIESVPGILLLDHSSDWDHNRTVVTFAGAPSSVVEAAYCSIRVAAERINLDVHEGTHPRLGAADVVPFVPLQKLSLDECAALARELGQRVATELHLPVYCYEAAALRPDRKRLEHVRRGQYEALKSTIATDPDRKPDYGPSILTPAGAVIIGARQPLIAFNIYFNTDDVTLAKRIASAIRESSGGFTAVKALGMLVQGRAQVSMNFTDFTQTGLDAVVEAVRHHAEAHSIIIHHAELIGLVPQQAILDVAAKHLHLDSLRPEQILETQLYSQLLIAAQGE
jgi:glutamate formiminotransferase